MFIYIFESIGAVCVLGLRGQVSVVEEGREVCYRVASSRSSLKLPPCPMEPMPAGSKMDLPLAEAEPIYDSGSTSVITT